MSESAIAKLKTLRPEDGTTWMGCYEDSGNVNMTSKAQILIDQLQVSIQNQAYPSVGTRLQIIEEFIHFYFTAFDRDRDSIYETSPLGEVFHFVAHISNAVDVPFNAVDNSWDLIADATR